MEKIKERISIEEVKVNKLRSLSIVNSMKSFVEGKSGIFYHHLPALDIGTNKVEIREVNTGIYDMSFTLKFKRLSNTDKIEIQLYNQMLSPQNKELSRRFYPENALKEYSPNMVREVSLVMYRMKFLIPLAISSVVAGSKASVFDYNQRIENRLLRVNHSDMYDFTRQYISYTGDFNVDFQATMLNLWFNYPIDITGFDDKIKRITLEEMNI